MAANLEERLYELLDRVEGAIAALLASEEGLLVEGVRKRKVDLEALAAEHAALLRQAQRAYAASLGTQTVGEILVASSQVVGYAKTLGQGLFLLLLLEGGANWGQARLQAERIGRNLKEVGG